MQSEIRILTPKPDISEVMDDVEALLNNSIATEPYHIEAQEKPAPLVDLTKIDFEKLAKEFETSRKRTEAEKLQALISKKLGDMLRANKSRVNFLEKFQLMIEEYNAGSKNIEQFFAELMAFAQNLSDEEKRGIAEGLTEEELALFDILTKPEPRLSRKEEEEVKNVAKTLLQTLKREKLVLDWREKQQARAAVRKTIGRTLTRALPSVYTEDMRNAEKRSRICAHLRRLLWRRPEHLPRRSRVGKEFGPRVAKIREPPTPRQSLSIHAASHIRRRALISCFGITPLLLTRTVCCRFEHQSERYLYCHPNQAL